MMNWIVIAKSKPVLILANLGFEFLVSWIMKKKDQLEKETKKIDEETTEPKEVDKDGEDVV